MDGINGILVACRYNFNLEVIKFLIIDLNYDIESSETTNGENGLMLACSYNKNLEIIKYFINDLHVNINKVNKFGSNILMKAVWYNENVNIIEYLIKVLKIDVNCVNKFSFTCFNFTEFKNIDVLKFFLQNVRIYIRELFLLNDKYLNKTYFIYLGFNRYETQSKKYKKIKKNLFYLN